MKCNGTEQIREELLKVLSILRELILRNRDNNQDTKIWRSCEALYTFTYNTLEQVGKEDEL